ncbi:MAG: NRDE family protein [Flavobacteriaceae bacterium]
MCTVTYIPIDNKRFILTSNRDESPMRKTIPPKIYLEDGVRMTYPKDELAGGTWIGVSEKKRLVCLLNGGFEKHQRNKYYRMSRGVVVKNILSVDDPVAYIKGFDFKDIEPFTIVLLDWSVNLKAYELVWDGVKTHFNGLKNKPKIWSSSSLYDTKMKEERVQWFNDWLVNNAVNQKGIMRFHQNTDLGTAATALKMKRLFVETVSITSVKKENETITIDYRDFLNDKDTALHF